MKCGTTMILSPICPRDRNGKNRWGETLHKFVNTIWHFDFDIRIDRLAELHQIYLIP